MEEEVRPAGDARDDAAQRFGKAGSARSSAVLEDYTELIADLDAGQGEARTTDIARALGVTHPHRQQGHRTAETGRARHLQDLSWHLPDRGRPSHGRALPRPARTVVKLLLAVGVPPEAAEIDAEGIEHHVSNTMLDAFDGFLGTKC